MTEANENTTEVVNDEVKTAETETVAVKSDNKPAAARRFSLLIRSMNSLPILNLCLNSFHQTASDPSNVEFLVVSHRDGAPEGGNIKHIKVEDGVGATEALNLAASEASGDILWVLTDEFLCITKDWDTEINSALDEHGDNLALIMVDDNLHNKVAGVMEQYGSPASLVTKTSYDKLGCVHPPEVQGGGADTAIYYIWKKNKPECVLNLADKVSLVYLDKVKWPATGGRSELTPEEIEVYTAKLTA